MGFVWSEVNEKGPKDRGLKGKGGISWSKDFEEELGQVPSPPPKPNNIPIIKLFLSGNPNLSNPLFLSTIII